MTTHVNQAGDLSWYTATSNTLGIEIYVQARLWVDAREAAVRDLTARFGVTVSQDDLKLEEMPAGWEPPRWETSVGSLAGDRIGGRP